MNKPVGAVSSEITQTPPGYDMERFTSLCAEIDSAILSCKIHPAFALDSLQAILDGGLVVRDFPVWKKLAMRVDFSRKPLAEGEWFSTRISNYYRERFDGGGFKIRGLNLTFHESSVAQGYLQAAFWKGEIELDLVRVTPRQFGFRNLKGVARATFFDCALHSGLEKCCYEVAFALRLAYLNQPLGEWLTIATDTNVPDAPDRLLRVGRGREDDPLCVTEVVSDGKTKVGLDDEYVFIKPRKGVGS